MPGLVGISRVLRLIVHGVGAPGFVPLHAEGFGSPRPRDGGQGLLQRGLLQAQGHLQEVNRHLEGLYFDHLVGLVSGENGSPACGGDGKGSAVAAVARPSPAAGVPATGERPLAHHPRTTTAPAPVAKGDGDSAGKGNLGRFGAFFYFIPCPHQLGGGVVATFINDTAPSAPVLG